MHFEIISTGTNELWISINLLETFDMAVSINLETSLKIHTKITR